MERITGSRPRRSGVCIALVPDRSGARTICVIWVAAGCIAMEIITLEKARNGHWEKLVNEQMEKPPGRRFFKELNSVF